MAYSVETPNSAVPGFRTLIQPDKLATYYGGALKPSLGGYAPVNLTAYPATIKQGGAVIATYNVPRHDYHARWIHDLLPDDIIRSPAQIVAQRLMFAFGTPGTHPPATPTNKYTGPTSPAGISTVMGGTGGRGDIGILTEWEAYAMRTGDFSFCLEAAKGFDSMPIFCIDPATSRFLSMLQYPYACRDGRTTHQATLIPTPDGNALPKGQWSMDISHHPAIYIAFLATNKLRYLESLQALTLFCLQVFDYYSAKDNKNRCIIHCGQMRGCWWTWRSLLMAYRATLLAEQVYGTLPEPLLPSTEFLGLINWNLDYFTEGFVKDPALDAFRVFPDVTCYRPWQFPFGLEAMALGVLFGVGQKMTDMYEWSMANAVRRLNNTSGHPPAMQVEYQYRLGPAGTMPDGANGFPFEIKAGQFFHGPQPWKEAWDAFTAEAYAAFAAGATSFRNMTKAQIDALVADPLGGGDYINWDNLTPQNMRQVMAEADHLEKLGLTKLATLYPEFPICRDRMQSMVLRWEAKSAGNKIESRMSIVSSLGGIVMPSAVSINLGQKVHLDVAFTGPKPPQPPTYTQTDGTIGTLTAPDMSGVLFTSTKIGKSVVTAATAGPSGPISDSCEVTVNNPLPTAITLTPGTVS